MPTWTKEQLAIYEQRRNAYIKRRMDSAGGAGTPAKLESGAGAGALGKTQAEGQDSAKFLVRVTSRRKWLLDEDNLCEKYHVDCLRYAGIIPGDAPGQTRIEVRQEKVSKGEQEDIVIEVYEH